MAKFVVTGHEQVIEKLARLRKTEMKKAIRKGSRAGAKLVQARAKALVPRRTGALANAIKVRSWPRSRKWSGTQVTTAIAAGGVFYGGFIEAGTKTKSGRVRIKARRFIRDAFDQQKTSAGAAFIQGITEVVDKVK